MEQEDAARLIRDGYALQFSKVAQSVSRPVYWYSRRGRYRSEILNNGTVFFLDLGDGVFGITASHVIAGIREAHHSVEGLVVGVGNAELDVSTRIISESQSRDITTFRVAASEIAEIGCTTHGPLNWPCTPPLDGRGVLYGGWRGCEKTEDGWEANWGFSYGLGPVASVHEDRITVQFDRESWIETDGIHTPEPGEPWGGVSGSPVFALYEDPVIHCGLVAVVTEFNPSFEIVIANTLGKITSQGVME